MAVLPKERHRPPEPEVPQESRPRERERQPRGQRKLLWVLLAASLALLVLFIASHFDEYLRRTLEAKINQRLKGYTVTIGHAHLSPFGLSLALERLLIRQQGNPQPPVADLPRLTASVEWREILRGHLVADAVFERPRVHVNLAQLRKEDRDEVEVEDRGWQQALESIYPLKFNMIQVRNGDLVYIDEDPEHPLHISRWNFTAANVRNVRIPERSPERVYPSSIHSDGVIFETGRGVLDGHANFLAEPFPAFQAKYRVENVPLERLRQIGSRANLTVRGGALSSHGDFEYGPKHKDVHIADVTVRKLRLDYTHSPATTGADEKIEEVSEDPTPEVPVRIDRFEVEDGRIGLVSWAKDRRFRVFVDDTDFTVTNISSGFRKGPAKAIVTGKFMGSGALSGHATFRDDRKGPDFTITAQIEGASLPSINELLLAYGKFDVVSGTFSVYSEVKVRNGRIDGYVKPLFKDIKVYSREQDKKKPVLKRLYEKIVGGLSHVLENEPREQVATVADISGTIEDPNTGTWPIIVRLVSNAFVRAILPGFEREYEAAGKKR
ncbi:MAG TPA: DUF748 domain-containing protein [Thermoanaerobaculia bacterium]|nr:DUF748 domain-containing protein [Thermoanaerobaculia bacterium]